MADDRGGAGLPGHSAVADCAPGRCAGGRRGTGDARVPIGARSRTGSVVGGFGGARAAAGAGSAGASGATSVCDARHVRCAVRGYCADRRACSRAGEAVGEPGTSTGARWRRVPVAVRSQQRTVVEAFLTALQAGDFDGLLTVLDPDVVVRVDAIAARAETSKEIRGAENWARGAIAFSKAISQTAGSVAPMLIDR